jgi:hypothetical protein
MVNESIFYRMRSFFCILVLCHSPGSGRAGDHSLFWLNQTSLQAVTAPLKRFRACVTSRRKADTRATSVSAGFDKDPADSALPVSPSWNAAVPVDPLNAAGLRAGVEPLSFDELWRFAASEARSDFIWIGNA